MNDNLDLGNIGITDLDNETRKLIRDTHTESDDNSERIRKLESKLTNLSLVTEALWTLLNKRTKLTNEDLAASIQEVIQTRRTREESKLTCVKCKMQNSINHKKCMYCGGELLGHTEKSLFNF
ncbi:hypothetical protein D0C16_23830 [Cellvibrio sp. KY-GH-1]|uniref:hypothetical protein n=1 Tax=Cellvibrio sp. KY-GH-1 TaxID=2303332 RepID=UPI001246F305|nr:hypothetical protein [Cellvibrio sp. KY-GH-1]QEY18745.1 hypothetical protein D0C16_23830 [Cellvibrio sp. KY-GH-1]